MAPEGQEDLRDEGLHGDRERGAAYGLSDEFITTVFTAIHEESVRKQNEILSQPL